jgi:hypothetical protein
MDILGRMLVAVVVMNTFILISAPYIGVEIPDNPLGGFYNINAEAAGQPGEGVETNYTIVINSTGVSSSDPLSGFFAAFSYAYNFAKSLVAFVNAPVTLLNVVGAPGAITMVFMAVYYPLLVVGIVAFVAGRVI